MNDPILTRIGRAILAVIAIVWLLMWALLFGHMGAVCTAVILRCLLNEDLPLAGYSILLPTAMLSLLAQIVLSKPWPGRADSIRSLLRGLTAIPFAFVVLAIAGGVLIYAYLQFAG